MAGLPLLKGNFISLEDALTDDDNILHRLDYPQKLKAFCSDLLTHRRDIESLVSFHLGVKDCQVAEEADWLFGSYNVCIPIHIGRQSEERVLFRVPLPFKIGEETFPGNSNEKLRCEVATYIWILENCPDVPIPSLYGFAFPNGQAVSRPVLLSYSEELRLTLPLVCSGEMHGLVYKMALALEANHPVMV
ncbi:hypothetical protein N7481_010262 [Penicillium waksmanii]|jgi:hypothetical protein|uniref:uncharacterized protein n=1 Tax=Penicillium waksmanii TaxID=69791 RepID=UPI002546EA7C|nr:uncharacterized protein N7481_010262 [Penicillium waksmanii]KAJ5976555.1 hypothetical protein N7481_010262 [Penicillium waksmanii]